MLLSLGKTLLIRGASSEDLGGEKGACIKIFQPPAIKASHDRRHEQGKSESTVLFFNSSVIIPPHSVIGPKFFFFFISLLVNEMRM